MLFWNACSSAVKLISCNNSKDRTEVEWTGINSRKTGKMLTDKCMCQAIYRLKKKYNYSITV